MFIEINISLITFMKIYDYKFDALLWRKSRKAVGMSNKHEIFWKWYNVQTLRKFKSLK
jgi:hypothetical protein